MEIKRMVKDKYITELKDFEAIIVVESLDYSLNELSRIDKETYFKLEEDLINQELKEILSKFDDIINELKLLNVKRSYEFKFNEMDLSIIEKCLDIYLRIDKTSYKEYLESVYNFIPADNNTLNELIKHIKQDISKFRLNLRWNFIELN